MTLPFVEAWEVPYNNNNNNNANKQLFILESRCWSTLSQRTRQIINYSKTSLYIIIIIIIIIINEYY